ncbi:MAG: hypothetical protein KBC30_09420 [Planctomycetes bacterium]|jgi:ribosomal protein L37AE/L43A|nr:hypothetical protein [Planctomycetota bacterium]HNZ67249.1 hypothetical protein [Planctomycetota bacterium]HON45658.1 hypothetical protein [Planctomycetota bacterium]HPY75602.1 hypothetical protein [Planctomycetota bacterium]HQB01371.1 hypothetical protein [Planctomycetota bacterium]
MVNKVNVEERLLGMMAVEKAFISEKQLKKCLNILEFMDTEASLADIFLKENYLTQNQIERLQQQLQISTELDHKHKQKQGKPQKTFGEIALEQYMIDNTQLNAALDEQAKYAERGIKIQLGQILQTLGYLTIAQVGRILQYQLKKMLYCKNCKSTKSILDYKPGQIYQCDKCKLDLIEAKIKKKKEKPKKQILDDDLDDLLEQDDDGGVGSLQVLEL